MKLTGVELRHIAMPLVAPFRTSFGTQTTRDVLLVRVVTDEAEGWGECVAMTDPLYALYLTTGDSTDRADASASHFQARLTAEEHRIHNATNRFWPQRLGSTPVGLSSELNRHADALGARYEPRLVVGAGGKSALRDAVDAAGNDQPVPVLIGNRIPRHYILLIGLDGPDLLVYEPGYATVDRISAQSFLDGKLDLIGFHHIYSVVTPHTEGM